MNTDALDAQWRESERRMYPLATTSPEKYETLVRVARRVANDLNSVRSTSGLYQTWPEAEERTQVASRSLDISLGDLPITDVAGVGYALRAAELRGIEHQEEQRRLVAQARTENAEWVTLHSQGDVEQGLMNAYQAIEMHLGSGVAIVSSVESNPATSRANYVLTVIQMDAMTAAVVDIDPGIADPQEHDDVALFTQARRRLEEVVALR
ncbi:hypothetical protein [uncultured Ilumatobacter sp.]|uniref:hypothetical protein n=1 Tax=uncultured Ilumatobacter sp. TaxID=879968 RepID=UPI00374FBBAD